MENRPEVLEKVAARRVKGDKREIGKAKVGRSCLWIL